MRILYLDCFSGISGDMVVGALIDAGVPLEVIRDAVRRVGLTEEDVAVSVRPIMRSQIAATKFDVVDRARPGVHAHDSAPDGEGSGGLTPAHGHDHHHDHDHEDRGLEHVSELDDAIESAPAHADQHADQHGRSYAEIVDMIERSDLDPRVSGRALEIFRQIAVAEARIHDVRVDDVHFHEVGAVDSIVDIVGIAAALEHLGIEQVFTSVIPLGAGGLLRSAHGPMPLPAPATAEILKGYPVRLTDLPFELTTPTGAGVVKALSSGLLALEEITIDRIGFGAGTRELPDRPNLLRAIVGVLARPYERETVVVIEASIDDMNPQVYPWIMDRLLGSGALDCHLTQVIMKKGRPGVVLTVIAPRAAVESLARIIFDETTTIGVRYREVDRLKLEREEVLVSTRYGRVRMKRVSVHGEVRVIPEYEEARRIAQEHGTTLVAVLRELQDAAREHS